MNVNSDEHPLAGVAQGRGSTNRHRVNNASLGRYHNVHDECALGMCTVYCIVDTVEYGKGINKNPFPDHLGARPGLDKECIFLVRDAIIEV